MDLVIISGWIIWWSSGLAMEKARKKKHALPSTTTSLPMSKGRKSQVRTKYANFRSLRFGRYPWLPCGRPVIPHCFCVWIYPSKCANSMSTLSFSGFRCFQTSSDSIWLNWSHFFPVQGRKYLSEYNCNLHSASPSPPWLPPNLGG